VRNIRLQGKDNGYRNAARLVCRKPASLAVYLAGAHRQRSSLCIGYTPISKQLLAHLIEVLCGHATRWEWSQGSPAEAQEYYELMAVTCTALEGVIAAEAATVRHGGAREEVLLIQDFLASARAGELRDAVRTDRDVDGDVVDALKTASGPIQKRRMEQLAKLPPTWPATAAGPGTTRVRPRPPSPSTSVRCQGVPRDVGPGQPCI
jgi:hypothetical protein